jgi:hypothetical protein
MPGGNVLETKPKVCPVCNQNNDVDASICVYCGAPLAGSNVDPTTEIMKKVTIPLPGITGLPEADQLPAVVPPDAIAIYIVGVTRPIVVTHAVEFILGRHVVEGADNIIDLTPYQGLEKGVSRKHAVIHKMGKSYDIVDLYSTNGTWIDEKRLLPNKSYNLDSGIHFRLGQLALFTQFGPEIIK